MKCCIYLYSILTKSCLCGHTKSRPFFRKSSSNSEKVLARFAHTSAIFTGHIIMVSNESREIADRVSVRLFRTRNQLDSALRGRLTQSDKCLVIADRLLADGPNDLQAGHDIGRMSRTSTGNIRRFREGVIRYLFVRLSNLSLVGDLTNLDLIIYEDSLLCQLPII
jgi:hypothetical protein